MWDEHEAARGPFLRALSQGDVPALAAQFADLFGGNLLDGMSHGNSLFADGRVNACHCHGTDGSLVIGDVREKPLSWILSPQNPAFMNLIDRHQRGDYPQACLDCKFYRSIYRKLKRVHTISVSDYMTMIARRA